MSSEIDKKLFEQIFGHTLIQLTKKLTYTKNKEGNQITVKNINENKEKLYKQDDYYNFVIQQRDRRINLLALLDLFYTLMKNSNRSDLKM